jgi:hypothetical protein
MAFAEVAQVLLFEYLDDNVSIVSTHPARVRCRWCSWTCCVRTHRMGPVLMLSDGDGPDQHRGGGGERLIKDLKRKANSLSRGTRQAGALGLGVPAPRELLR